MAKKTISPELKLKIVLEALKEERHPGNIASEHGMNIPVRRSRGSGGD